MRQFNIFEAIYMSFYSRALYKDVAVTWKRMAPFYLLILLCLSWMPVIYQIHNNLTLGFKKYAVGILSQMPVIEIKDGKISTPYRRPLLIKHPATQAPLVIINTTGKYSYVLNPNVPLVITDKEIIARSANDARVFHISKSYNQKLAPIKIYTYMKQNVGHVWIPLFILAVLVSFIYRLVQSLLYAAIGKVFNYFYRANLSYRQLIQITMVALTPAIVIATIQDSFGFYYQHQLFLYFVLSILYMLFGIAANKEKETS